MHDCFLYDGANRNSLLRLTKGAVACATEALGNYDEQAFRSDYAISTSKLPTLIEMLEVKISTSGAASVVNCVFSDKADSKDCLNRWFT